MSKIGEKEAAQRAMRAARFNKKPPPGTTRAHVPDQVPAESPMFPEVKAQGKRKDGSIEHPAARREREIDEATTGDFKDSQEPGKAKLTIRIDKELMKEIKITCVEHDYKIEAFVERAIRVFIEHGEPENR